MSILFKGNLEEGNYTLIKSTDGWVLKGETSYVGFNFADRKDENSSEKPNNCTDCECTDDCTECREAEHGCKDEPQTMYYPQVDGITPSVIVKDKSQTERSK